MTPILGLLVGVVLVVTGGCWLLLLRLRQGLTGMTRRAEEDLDKLVGPRSSRDWSIMRMPDGVVVIVLIQTLSDGKPGDTRHRGTAFAVPLLDAEMAAEVWASYEKQQDSVVERALKDGVRLPEMTAAAPGVPRKEGAR